MRVAILGIENNTKKLECLDLILAPSLEEGTTLGLDIYTRNKPSTHDNFSCVDADEAGILCIGDAFLDGEWHRYDSVKNLGWVAIRNERKKLLDASDWTALTDSPLSSEKKTEWATYRQTLRDITTSTEKPENVVWPSAPSM